ncbi:hypothetical protein LI148_12310 [Colidextribacter sp. 210702-DFI.3.9]|nr:hypothetical protein [Colidextribacter sp. 210702-DFI.3.9]
MLDQHHLEQHHRIDTGEPIILTIERLHHFIQTCEVHRCIYLSQQMLLRHQLVYDYELYQISIHFPAFQHLASPLPILPYLSEKAQLQPDFFDRLGFYLLVCGNFFKRFQRIEPEKIICYHTPFPEMQGDIIYVDYERSSWKYMDDEKTFSENDVNSYKIGGNSHVVCDTMEPYLLGGATKGGGSAYGGKWRPNPKKPTDQRYLGTPGEINVTVMQNGDIYKTKIGSDGRAEIERHETDHNKGHKHSNPHDHLISWDTPDEHPLPGPPINYPDGAPEFKNHGRNKSMSDIIIAGNMNFESISEFKQSLNWGAEIEFRWKGKTYNVIRYGTDNKITIYEANNPETDKVCESADDALDYIVGGDRLRDVITKVDVVARTI